jgi:hypothetical protein
LRFTVRQAGVMPLIDVAPWTGPWEPDDPDAGFKERVAESARVDPLHTLTNLSAAIGVPVGGLVHHVLAAWASAGSQGLLEIGPTEAQELLALAEAGDLEALRGRLRWLVSGS